MKKQLCGVIQREQMCIFCVDNDALTKFSTAFDKKWLETEMIRRQPSYFLYVFQPPQMCVCVFDRNVTEHLMLHSFFFSLSSFNL